VQNTFGVHTYSGELVDYGLLLVTGQKNPKKSVKEVLKDLKPQKAKAVEYNGGDWDFYETSEIDDSRSYYGYGTIITGDANSEEEEKQLAVYSNDEEIASIWFSAKEKCWVINLCPLCYNMLIGVFDLSMLKVESDRDDDFSDSKLSPKELEKELKERYNRYLECMVGKYQYLTGKKVLPTQVFKKFQALIPVKPGGNKWVEVD
jgi:hypothetical protein